MEKCPYPGCGLVFEIVLNRHAKEHGFKNAKEMFKKHGKPIKVSVPTNVQKWAKEKTATVNKYQFEGSEIAAFRLKKRKG